MLIKQIKYFCFLISPFVFLPLQTVNAQTIAEPAFFSQIAPEQIPPPQDILPPIEQPPAEPIQPLPPPEELLTPPSAAPGVEQPTEVPGTITVERFEFVGSTVFTQAELEAVTASYTKRPISFAELLQARSAVTQLYVDKGYVTSGAFIPPQELTEGVVRIEIVEGSVEEINVRGTKRLKQLYVRSRLKLGATTPLNVPHLLEALQLLQLDPLIKNISAELSAGTRPGTSILDVEIKEANSFNAEIFLDNGRSPSVGTFRRGLKLTEGNLFGFGDSLSASYTNTDGSDDFDFSYTIPWNARNGTLKLSYGTTSSDVIEPPFDDIDGDGNEPDIESESRYYEVTLRQPVMQTPNQEFVLGLTFSHQQTETSLLEMPFPLSPGADDEGRTRVSALRFFQEWTQRSQKQVLAARSQFSLGVDAFDSTMNANSPDSSFFSWRGQGQWVRLLGEDFLLLARTDLQLSDRPLVPLEQFGLGGLNSVRGYRQDAFLTDNGLLTSVELRVPLLRARSIQGVLQIVPFVDFGVAWNNGDRSDPDPNTIAGIGLGLQWQQGDRLTARFDWGIPIVDIDGGDRTLQEEGFYFSLIYRPF
jgi:hemolysin activation/secretion protein